MVRETRGPPDGQSGHFSSSNSNTLRLMGRDPGRPVKARGPPRELGGAANMKRTSHGPQPGPVHQILT